VLLYTGSRVFVELDDSFDVIWRGNARARASRAGQPQVAPAGAAA
jgi:hypothetical protein